MLRLLLVPRHRLSIKGTAIKGTMMARRSARSGAIPVPHPAMALPLQTPWTEQTDARLQEGDLHEHESHAPDATAPFSEDGAGAVTGHRRGGRRRRPHGSGGHRRWIYGTLECR